MYKLSEASITKQIESWKLIVPLHDNDGNDFDEMLIDSITRGITESFPGLTIITCVGLWKDGHQIYKDRNLELIIDVSATESSRAEAFFARYKDELRQQLHQAKIYLTKVESKTEIINYDEFFAEVGLEIDPNEPNTTKRRLAQATIENVNSVVSRMSYETTLLRRDPSRNVIIWERKVCGILLKAEIPDEYPPDIMLIAADRIDHHTELLKQLNGVVIIGDWEYQKFVVQDRPFTPLVEAEVPRNVAFELSQYLSQRGEPISHKRFIEEFTMAIVVGVMALRDEGFLPQEIAVNVGSDGSMQRTVTQENQILFWSPAPIPDSAIQDEILRCVGVALTGLQEGTLPALGVQQAKAMHKYIFKRGAVRQMLQDKNQGELQ